MTIGFALIFETYAEVWRDGSVVKHRYCFPENLSWVTIIPTNTCNSSYKGSDVLLWPPWAVNSHTHTLTQTQGHTDNKK